MLYAAVDLNKHHTPVSTPRSAESEDGLQVDQAALYGEIGGDMVMEAMINGKYIKSCIHHFRVKISLTFQCEHRG